MDCITDLEHFTLNEGNCTPLYYGLPKLHKVFTLFPYFQPICSGSNSCTNRLSEWIDSFLKAAAQKLLYVQDITSFINKMKKLKFKGNVLIAVLGVPCSKPLGGSKVDSALHPSEGRQNEYQEFLGTEW